MQFFYRAKTKNGETIEGLLEANDKFSLLHELKSRGYFPLQISEKKSNALDLNVMFQKFFGRVSIQEQIIFTKNLSGMIKAGLSLSRAISVLKKQTKNAKFGKVLETLDDEIDSGGSLSQGLAKFPSVFSNLFVSMVRAGEESGNLAQALSEIGANLEKSHKLTKKVKGALIYPGVVFSAMVLIGILMFAFVVPTLAKTFKDVGAKLPASTKFIIFMGDFISNNLALVFLILIAIGVGGYFLFKAKSMAKYIDFMILRLPAIKTMSKQLNTARTARTISSLLTSGVSISRSIDIAQDVVQNIYYKKVLGYAREAVEKGLPLSSAFVANPDLYPVMMAEMVQVGEETGKLSEMLLQVALFFEEEVENKTKNLSTIIEPVLMIFVGAAVGFFALSMITPLYSVMSNIK